jgi:peptidoglycan/LPS O-acetylase OafA/YrhL
MVLGLVRRQNTRISHEPRNVDGHSVRPEVQALRALAVVLVVVYHVNPYGLLPGGYIGVDVFFVISGFLITAHIAKGLERDGGFKLRGFYMRRIRRLLPAALTVLAVVGVMTLVFLPATRWSGTAPEIASSVFYVQNWYLAEHSVAYLAAETRSPIEHFWSLSVEEQFYLFWPALLILAAWIGRRFARARTGLVSAVAAITVASFAFSVLATDKAPYWAYFATTTRVWELGAGGLLALTVPQLRIGRRYRIALSWAGLVVIAWCAINFNARTVFPGYIAVVPVIATAAVISAGDVPGRLSTSWLTNLRATQFIGDISYSIYLWHWPLIALAPWVILGAGYTLPPYMWLIPVIACVFVAWLSKRYIEDPFRLAGSTSRADPAAGRNLVLAATTSLAVIALVVAAVLHTVSQDRIRHAHAEMSAFERGSHRCVGAEALTTDCAGLSPDGVHPAPIIAAEDFAAIECQQTSGQSDVVKCEYGPSAGAARNVAVVGDSHIYQWRPAIEEAARQRNWHVDFYVMAGCPFAESLGTPFCRRHTEAVSAILLDHPVDIVITSAGPSGYGYGSGADYRQSVVAFADTWRGLMANGMRVVVIADLPSPIKAGIEDPVGSVEVGVRPTYSKSDGLGGPDALVGAAHQSGAAVIDMSNQLCINERCPTVIGGVLVYVDNHHMTATYSRSVAPALGRAIDHALATTR